MPYGTSNMLGGSVMPDPRIAGLSQAMARGNVPVGGGYGQLFRNNANANTQPQMFGRGGPMMDPAGPGTPGNALGFGSANSPGFNASTMGGNGFNPASPGIQYMNQQHAQARAQAQAGAGRAQVFPGGPTTALAPTTSWQAGPMGGLPQVQGGAAPQDPSQMGAQAAAVPPQNPSITQMFRSPGGGGYQRGQV